MKEKRGKRKVHRNTHQLSNGFGEEMMVTSEGMIGNRSFSLEVKMRENFAIG
jgi:hypothetical protein